MILYYQWDTWRDSKGLSSPAPSMLQSNSLSKTDWFIGFHLKQTGMEFCNLFIIFISVQIFNFVRFLL